MEKALREQSRLCHVPPNLVVSLFYRKAKSLPESVSEDEKPCWDSFFEHVTPWKMRGDPLATDDSRNSLQDCGARFLGEPEECWRCCERAISERIVALLRGGQASAQKVDAFCEALVAFSATQVAELQEFWAKKQSEMAEVGSSMLAVSGVLGPTDSLIVKRMQARSKLSTSSLSAVTMAGVNTSAYWQDRGGGNDNEAMICLISFNLLSHLWL